MNSKCKSFPIILFLVGLMTHFGNSQSCPQNSIKFDGRDNLVSMGICPNLSVTGSLTMEAWIYPTGPGKPGFGGVGGMIINKEGEYQISMGFDGKLWYSIANTDPGWVWTQTGYTPPLNEWTHIAFTYDYSSVTNIGTIQLYTNSIPQYTYVGSGPIDDVYKGTIIGDPLLDEFNVGSRQNGFSGTFFEGSIDEVRIWKTALSQADIQAWYNTSVIPSHPQYSNIIGYWRFDEGSGIFAADVLGRNNGTLLNGAARNAGVNMGPNSCPTGPITQTPCAPCVTENTTSYIVYAKKEARFGEDNIINGSVGVTDARGKASFYKKCMLPNPYFVKAKDITVKRSASIANQVEIPANDGPNPPFFNFSGNTTALPKYTATTSTAVPITGNFEVLKVKKNVSVTIVGTLYGTIIIEEGAQVTFNPSGNIINIETLNVKGKSPSMTRVFFTNSTSVRIKKKVDIDDFCEINKGGPQVTFYVGNGIIDEEKFSIHSKSTSVTANIYIPSGKIKVYGGHNAYCMMTGWFIAEKMESGKKIIWNHYTCSTNRIMSNTKAITSFGIENIESGKSELTVNVYPNPSSSHFRINIKNKRAEPVTIRVFNTFGSVVKVINNAQMQSSIAIGHDLKTGTYFAEVVQGKNRKVLKLIKIN